MRKIIIDDRIRAFALEYSKKVQVQCPNVIHDLESLRDNVIAYNVWGNSSVVKDYLDQIIADYPALLILEPKDWNLKKYEKILNKEPGVLSRVVNYKIKKKGIGGQPDTYYKGKLYERIIFCLRYDDTRVILGGIHKDAELNTCVYCNIIPTISNDGEVLYQMDHFLPQSEYPFIGTCFYNLQPSCGICNNHKGDQPCSFGLYVNEEQHKEIMPFRLLPSISKLPEGDNPECIDINLMGKNKRQTKESKEHNKIFHIHACYSNKLYKGIVSRMYFNAYKTDDSAITAISASYGINPSKKDVIAYLADGVSLDESKIHEAPLTKLKQDTIKQLEEAGIIT